jgi:hypothetical protein
MSHDPYSPYSQEPSYSNPPGGYPGAPGADPGPPGAYPSAPGAYPSTPGAYPNPPQSYGYSYPQPAAPYGQPVGFAQGGYGMPAQPSTNSLALTSMILGISAAVVGFFGLFLSFFMLLAFPAAVAAVITGHIGLSTTKKTGQSGAGMALTGIIIGYVVAGLGLLLLGLGVILGIFLAVGTL